MYIFESYGVNMGFTGNIPESLQSDLSIFFSASHAESFFDHIYSGVTFPSTFIHDLDTLAEIARILKPSGSFLLRQPTG